MLIIMHKPLLVKLKALQDKHLRPIVEEKKKLGLRLFLGLFLKSLQEPHRTPPIQARQHKQLIHPEIPLPGLQGRNDRLRNL